MCDNRPMRRHPVATAEQHDLAWTSADGPVVMNEPLVLTSRTLRWDLPLALAGGEALYLQNDVVTYDRSWGRDGVAWAHGTCRPAMA